MCGGRINRTQGTVRGRLAEPALQCFLVSRLCSPSLCCESHSKELLLLVSGLVLIAPADLAETWLFLLGHVTAADSCLLSQHYWTGLLVYSWSIQEDWLAAADLWTKRLISWQCRLDLLQRTISKQVHFPCSLSFLLPLVGVGLEGRLKHLRSY